jgi:LacI family transcriptional regulator
MPTIREVALHANVSAATVSHVINQTRRVDPDTSARVQQSIKTLGYQPNLLARSLRRRETRTIGLLVPDNANSFFAEFARVVEDLGFARGYSVILCNSDRSADKEQAYLKVLLSKQVDGLIVISSTNGIDLLKPVVDAGVPLVVVDHEPASLPMSQVSVANEHGGYLAGQHLIQQGHRRVGCIGGPSDAHSSWQRVVGFRQALRDRGLVLPDEAIVQGDFRYASGAESMRTLLGRNLGLTAVFAANDLMAIGAMNFAHRAGYRVPHELSFVGFDNIAQSATTIPALTTIEQPVGELGEGAVELLFDQILKRATPGRRTVMTHLVERESCHVVGDDENHAIHIDQTSPSGAMLIA